MAEVPPVHLALLARQAAQPQIRLGRPARTMTGEEVAEVIGAATVAALAHHRVEAAGGERRELLQGLEHERQVRLDLRAARRRTGSRQAGLGQHPHYGAMVHVQLAGDGADAPLLDMVITQNLRFEIRRDGHGSSPRCLTAVRASRRRGRNPVRTKRGQRHPHQWQRQNPGP